MAYISTIISGVISFGVLFGLISGIFFLVLTALRWVSRIRATLYEEEIRRQKRFLSHNSYLLNEESSKSLEEYNNQNGYEPSLCSATTPKNIETKYQQSEEGNTFVWNNNETEEKPVENKGTTTTDSVPIRDFIEKLVETLIGGSLDGITVGKLSNHSAYLEMFAKYHGLLCRELATLNFALQQLNIHETSEDFELQISAHSRLKRLLEQILSEAMTSPKIKEILRSSKVDKKANNENFQSKSYEDILATAILNQIMKNAQKEHERKGKSAFEDDLVTNEKEKLKRSEGEEYEPTSNSDWSDSSNSDKLSLTIEEYIEEVTTTLEVSDDEKCETVSLQTAINRVPFPESGRIVRDVDIMDENSDFEEPSSITELITPTSSWEENWLFQKKRHRATPNAHHPVPVPMLVPNPSEDFRALVGGVDADDLSDISDCSDLITDLNLVTNECESFVFCKQRQNLINEEECNEISEDSTSIVKNHQNKNIVASVEDVNELNEENNSNGKITWENEEVSENVLESKEQNLSRSNNDDLKTSSLSPTSTENLSQQDREFSIEDVDLINQYQSLNSHTSQGIEASSENEQIYPKCSIAEREKEKWKNPVQLSENPYSQESIRKREKLNSLEYFRLRTCSQDCIDFPDDFSRNYVSEKIPYNLSRDYYINASKNPSGSSTSSPEQRSRKYDQDSSVGTTKAIPSDKDAKFSKIPDKNNNDEIAKPLVPNRSQFCLPSVKELAKQFTTKESKDSNPIDFIKSEKKLPGEITKSIHIRDSGQINGKQVHSLTARSISKEFREGLKNSSYQKTLSKIDRSSSGGESDQGEVISDKTEPSPTPSIDLQNMKKFWEEIITANLNNSNIK